MTSLILALALLSNPTDTLKANVAIQLEQMENVQAVQHLRSWSEQSALHDEEWTSRVIIYGGRQTFSGQAALPIPRQGVRPGNESFTLLQLIQAWPLVQQRDYFTFDGSCWWTEKKRRGNEEEDWAGFVPCDGRVYVDRQYQVKKIIQYLQPNRLILNASITVHYEWIQLKEKRLLPVKIEMWAQYRTGNRYRAEAVWSDYREFYADEPVVKEIEP